MSRMFTPRATAARQGVLATFLSAGLLAAGATGANAGFVLTLDDLSTAGIDVVVVDNSAIGTPTALVPSTDLDSAGSLGAISFSGTVGAFSINVTTGLSKPNLGGSNSAVMDLNSVNFTAATAGTLQIMLTDTDFSLPGSGFWPHTMLTQGIGGTTNGIISSQAWIDTNNVEFGNAVLGANLDDSPGLCPDSATPLVFAKTCSIHYDNMPVTTFSLTQLVKITHTGGYQVTSFDSHVSFGVPEPATLALIGSGLLGLGLLRRRRAA